MPTRDDLASQYLDTLPYDPYPVQEEALLAWFTAEQGIMVCAPTGMGKTLIAEAALFEALHTRTVAYYTTPLIALTEQKFREMQDAAERWGFSKDDIGLVTGNRQVNPDARILVVVAEILLNRLLHAEAFDFTEVSAVVMDEFHSFNDPERGAVWELSLTLMPKHVRLMLLSATVGNSAEFIVWLSRSHKRRIQLIQSNDRRVPLRYEWVGDQLLNEQIEIMAEGDDEMLCAGLPTPHETGPEVSSNDGRPTVDAVARSGDRATTVPQRGRPAARRRWSSASTENNAGPSPSNSAASRC